MDGTELIIELINNHYYDLQMYANFVINVDNEVCTPSNNITTKLIRVSSMFSNNKILFTDTNMEKLHILMQKIIIKTNRLTYSLKYNPPIYYFNSGSASSSILFECHNTIIKIFPCQLFHHYKYVATNNISKNIESPLYALFYKEAWMYFFCKKILSPYTLAFNCIKHCGTVSGFPISITDIIINQYRRSKHNKKNWFNLLIENKNDLMYGAIYACFEMNKLEGIMTDLIKETKDILIKLDKLNDIPDKWTITYQTYLKLLNTQEKLNKIGPSHGLQIVTNIINKQKSISQKTQLKKELLDNQIDLSFIFEYMYAKMITAYIGKIIFTDDHFDNIAYIRVKYARHYKIKCNGCDYNFYMPPGKMVQFIDYERYIFNYSHYDIYTNNALKRLPKSEFQFASDQLKELNKTYLINDYIYDKGIYAFIDPRIFDPKMFATINEYNIMVNILIDNFVYDIKTFCQVMSIHLPKSYMTPLIGEMKHFYIDLDDDDIRVINNDIMENII